MNRYILGAVFLVAAVCCKATPVKAQDDLRAVYRADNSTLTIEVQSNGDFRGITEGQVYSLLQIGGRNFLVFEAGETPQVVDVEIAAEAIRGAIPTETLAVWEALPTDLFTEIESAGLETINGRVGMAYRITSDGMRGALQFIISDDPELDLLRDAMHAHFSSLITLQPLTPVELVERIKELLMQGAPLSFAGSDLLTLERVNLESSSFALPAEPLDTEAARDLMIANGMLPETGQFERAHESSEAD